MLKITGKRDLDKGRQLGSLLAAVEAEVQARCVEAALDEAGLSS